jgi:hypothetical protein
MSQMTVARTHRSDNIKSHPHHFTFLRRKTNFHTDKVLRSKRANFVDTEQHSEETNYT